jgi:hypothetical protein
VWRSKRDFETSNEVAINLADFLLVGVMRCMEAEFVSRAMQNDDCCKRENHGSIAYMICRTS